MNGTQTNRFAVSQENWMTICDSLLLHPDEWAADQYTLWHRSGVKLWIGNGWMSVSAHNSATDVLLNLKGRWKIWQAYCQWKQRQLAVFMITEVSAKPA